MRVHIDSKSTIRLEALACLLESFGYDVSFSESADVLGSRVVIVDLDGRDFPTSPSPGPALALYSRALQRSELRAQGYCGLIGVRTSSQALRAMLERASQGHQWVADPTDGQI